MKTKSVLKHFYNKGESIQPILREVFGDGIPPNYWHEYEGREYWHIGAEIV